MRIEPSPKLRRRKRPENQAKSAKVRFVVRDRAEAPPSRGVGPTTILKVAIFLIVVVVGAAALWSKIQGPDPHYLTARKLVLDYEFGKPKKTRNYDHNAYRQALGELALVKPSSRSAEPAEAMRIEIERNVTEFRKRQEEIERQLNAARAKNRKKTAMEFQARLRSQVLPVTEYPECEEEGMGNPAKKDTH